MPISEDQRRRLYAMADDYWGVDGNPGVRDLIRNIDERTRKLERELPVIRWMARGALGVGSAIVGFLIVMWQRFST